MNRSMIVNILPPLALMLFGAAIAVRGSAYGVGSLTAMGSGYLAVAFGVLLVLLALLQLLSQWHESKVAAGSENAFPWLALLLAAGSVLVWALLVERIGFIPAAVVQLALACLAAPISDWRHTAIGIVLFSLASYALFVWVLGLPVPAFGG